MISQWWSFSLVAIGVTGFWLTSRNFYIVGWGLNIFVQLLWIIYAVASRQWWFIISAFFYGGVFGLNLRREVHRARERDDHT